MKVDAARAMAALMVASAMPALVALLFSGPSAHSSDPLQVAVMLVLWYGFSAPVVAIVGIASILVSIRVPLCRWLLPPALGLGGGYLIANSMYGGSPPLEWQLTLALGGLAAGVTAAMIYFWPQIGEGEPRRESGWRMDREPTPVEQSERVLSWQFWIFVAICGAVAVYLFVFESEPSIPLALKFFAGWSALCLLVLADRWWEVPRRRKRSLEQRKLKAEWREELLRQKAVAHRDDQRDAAGLFDRRPELRDSLRSWCVVVVLVFVTLLAARLAYGTPVRVLVAGFVVTAVLCGAVVVFSAMRVARERRRILSEGEVE